MKKILKSVLYVAYLCGFMFGFFWILHQRSIGQIANNQKPSDYSFLGPQNKGYSETLRHVGAIGNVGFKNFSFKKKPGTIRVGCFGDSYTGGAEVIKSRNYPSYLQRLFTESGMNVEVINFGRGAHGGHQTFMMWKFLGTLYDLDHVLIGPASFMGTNTFNGSYRSPYYIHSRYILDGSGIKLISVPGRTHFDRFENYYSFIPDLSYWKYEARTLVAIQSAIGWDYRWPNPFYYLKGRAKKLEHREINSHFFKEMSQYKHSKFLLLHRSPKVVNVAKKYNGERFSAGLIKLEKKVPYRNSMHINTSHMSSIANYRIAQRFFAHVTNKESLELTDFEFEYVSGETKIKHPDSLSTKNSLFLRTGNIIVAYSVEMERFQQDVVEAPESWLTINGTDLIRSEFLPLDTKLDTAQQVYVKFGNKKLILGSLKRHFNEAPVWYIRYKPNIKSKLTSLSPRSVYINDLRIGNVSVTKKNKLQITETINPRTVMRISNSAEGDPKFYENNSDLHFEFRTKKRNWSIPALKLRLTANKYAPSLVIPRVKTIKVGD